MLSISTVAEILIVSEQYVRKLCRQGRLGSKKVGRDWVVIETEMELRKKFKKCISGENAEYQGRKQRKIKK